jgi:hypothetical protein
MKMINKYIGLSLGVFILFILTSCNYNKIISNTRIKEISFGSGGGFTNKTKVYRLTPKGDLYHDTNFLLRLSPKETKKLFLGAQNILRFEINKPYNVYSFITIRAQDTTKKFVWGTNDSSIEQEILVLYNTLKLNVKNK